MEHDTWEKVKIALGLLVGGSASSVGLSTVDESSAENGGGGLSVQLDGSSASSGESSGSTGNTTAASSAEGPIVGTTVVGGIIETAALLTYSAPSSSNEIVGHVNVDGKRYDIEKDSSGGTNIDMNTVPYCRVEKRAQKTYDVLHGDLDKAFNFPAVVAESKESYEAFRGVFGEGASPGKMLDMLSALEAALRRGNDASNN